MLIHRNIEVDLRQLARQDPVITIIGPRQSGNSTLAKITMGATIQ